MALSLASMCWASGGIVSNCRKYIIPAPPSHSSNNVSFDVSYFFFRYYDSFFIAEYYVC